MNVKDFAGKQRNMANLKRKRKEEKKRNFCSLNASYYSLIYFAD